MRSDEPTGRDIPVDDDLSVGAPTSYAAGVPAVARALRISVDQMGPTRATRTLLRVNQPDGFDCPGCAWPDPAQTRRAEFCENGAKAVAEEATTRRVTPELFARHSIDDLHESTDHWLGSQGRLTTPMYKAAGADHYEPVSWDRALDVLATHLRGLDDPDEAVFYTSGRTSNEAAFVYQLFARAFGTNNLPDCSNMCHESSGSALIETIGVGKGTVSIEDLEQAELIVIAGQNPATNHPRMLSTLATAKERGAVVVAINPLPEVGLKAFRDPQTVRGVVGGGVPIADDFLQVRLGGDQALFQAVGHLLLQRPDVLDRDFVERHTSGFDAYVQARATVDWPLTERATGLSRSQIERLADRFAASGATVVCWAMGLTQHRHSVPTIREIVNLLLLQGNIGRPGAGVCPVRGHSNVQGDRTMGIYEKPAEPFLAALDAEFGITAPRAHGYDVVESIRAFRDRRARVFVGMGGNFVRATPDSAVTEEALRQADLTVQISTKLNGSHAVTGREALILPTLGRTERDEQLTGSQRVTVEDSMSMVHASQGRLRPASADLLSEVAIVCELARRVLPDVAIDWAAMRADYRTIRAHVARVVPGFESYESRIDRPGGFRLPSGARDTRTFATSTQRARFTVNPLHVIDCPPGHLILQTVRSHDQYNTTIYGLDDHYRGVHQGRRVVFVSPEDLTELGYADGDHVDLVSVWPSPDGGTQERRAPRFRVVSYATARGCAAAYFPETNVLVPLDATAETSNTPTSKSVVIRLEPATADRAPVR
ncbi:FdhF/YdeP family oxidoreductase [Luteipulveratus flavus]|uniref:FdhF/YdeP family oxidoreductase n=1 Tax=Luteipulveratus flavus TaxID=3031728 RepID=A0ABT6CBU5_9MICO|nr:FdhF/YdeP family oxidoreductase [Luteipulveratus sp. YIM 133296]MDF8266260.1 FdhF/YdeP family oxidoreductase [Luteipulveratus sp. YIM 133296]